MPPSNLRSAAEALLFSSDQPLTLPLLSDALEAPAEEITSALHAIADEYSAREAGVQLREIAGGWVFVTAPEQNEWVTRMLRGKRRMRLSRAALETMAIIAYKQPVTKSEIEAIRGVDASGVLATLLERNLVTIKGRSTVVGRPLLYGSTDEFLNYFGLKDLTELPRPEELRALVAAREPEQLEMVELDPASGMPLALTAADEAIARANGDVPDGGAGDPAFSIADADAAIAQANAARAEAALALSAPETAAMAFERADRMSAGRGDLTEAHEAHAAVLAGGDDDEDDADAHEDDEDDEFDDEDEFDDDGEDEDGEEDDEDEDEEEDADHRSLSVERTER